MNEFPVDMEAGNPIGYLILVVLYTYKFTVNEMSGFRYTNYIFKGHTNSRFTLKLITIPTQSHASTRRPMMEHLFVKISININDCAFHY